MMNIKALKYMKICEYRRLKRLKSQSKQVKKRQIKQLTNEGWVWILQSPRSMPSLTLLLNMQRKGTVTTHSRS